MLQMWLGYGIATAVVWAISFSSDSTPSLGTSIGSGCRPKKTKKKVSFKNKDILISKKTRQIYCHQICTTRYSKRSSSGEKEMITNFDPQGEMKSIRNG